MANKIAMIVEFKSICYPKGLTIKIDGKTIYELRPTIEWDKPLFINTKQFGKCGVCFVGRSSKNKAVVQILLPASVEHYSEFFVPDENGYVVEFDRWIENEPT